MELPGVPPANCQLKVWAFADEVLVNCTVSGAQPLGTFAVKLAVGGVTMMTVWVTILLPQRLVAVNVTV